MTIKVLFCVSFAFALVTVGCNLRQSTSGAPTGTPPASIAASPTPAPASAAAPSVPKPNPLPAVGPGGNKDFAAVAGANAAAYGAAAAIHGSVAAGQVLFAQNCVACHGAEGKGGIGNANSDDGTVPTLNPLDPGFNLIAKGDPAIYVRGIDLYVQHGSLPPGPSPALSMSAWGDQNKLTQQQIADVEAYVMQLNGVTWAGK